jgi:exopolysaccharide biosynthesis polyprenyl glycosylphosphotransferase
MVAFDTLAAGTGMAVALLLHHLLTDDRLGYGVAMSLLSLAIWPVVFAQQGLYQARHLTRRIEELRRLVNAVLLGTIGLAGVAVVLQVSPSRSWLFVVAAAVFALVGLEREATRQIVRRLRSSGRMERRVLLVGDNSEADELIEMLQHSRELGYRVVGRVSDDRPDRAVHLVDDAPRVPWLGHTEDVLDIVRASGASSVVVATTAISLESANRLVRDLTREGIYVELSSSMRDIATRRVTLRPLGRYPVMCVEPVLSRGWRPALKRSFDLVAAALGLLVVAPVLAAAALAIRVTSGKGVFFRQTRVGRNGVPFTVFKLRTMVPDAEALLPQLLEHNEASGPMFKMTHDPRVTPVGRLLRKTSIDELPQLFNVLAGDMSLVGPRPALPHEAVQWNDDLRERLRVKPGITGNWQVNGRFTASIEDYQRLDLYYVDNWSLVTDLVILLKTLPAVLRRNGAA